MMWYIFRVLVTLVLMLVGVYSAIGALLGQLLSALGFEIAGEVYAVFGSFKVTNGNIGFWAVVLPILAASLIVNFVRTFSNSTSARIAA